MTLQFAEHLKNARTAAGLSQEELANKIGVSRQAISRWERGEASPDTDNLIELSRVLGVSIDSLVGDTPTKTHSKDSVHIGFDGIHVENERESVHISRDGIHVEDGNKSVHLSPEELKHKFHSGRKSRTLRYIQSLTFLAAVIAFLVFGFMGFWHPAWLIFLAAPVITSLAEAIEKRNASEFAYPILVVLAYLVSGLIYGRWHPEWIMFITIPVYYIIVDMFKKAGQGD